MAKETDVLHTLLAVEWLTVLRRASLYKGSITSDKLQWTRYRFSGPPAKDLGNHPPKSTVYDLPGEDWVNQSINAKPFYIRNVKSIIIAADSQNDS